MFAAMRERVRKRQKINRWRIERDKFGDRDSSAFRVERRGRYDSEHYMGIYAPNFIRELASKMRICMRPRRKLKYPR